ncbi:MAG: hypothetical protein PHO71_14155 [Bacteroides sp.]|nr:hypothetical protein [Bacteroides sp.]
MGQTVIVVGDLYNQLPSIIHIWGSSAPFPVGGCKPTIPYSLQGFVRINGKPIVTIGVTRISYCPPCPMTTSQCSRIFRTNKIPICRQGDRSTGPHPFGGLIPVNQFFVRSD